MLKQRMPTATKGLAGPRNAIRGRRFELGGHNVCMEGSARGDTHLFIVCSMMHEERERESAIKRVWTYLSFLYPQSRSVYTL